MKLNSEKLSKTDDYWYSVSATLQQLEGLYEGYKLGCTNNMNRVESSIQSYKTLDNPTLEHFLIISAWGDIYQIAMKYLEVGNESRLRGNKKLGSKNKSADWKLVERCSAIVKLLENNKDVVFGHSTWDSYESLGKRSFNYFLFIHSMDSFVRLFNYYTSFFIFIHIFIHVRLFVPISLYPSI